MKYRKEPMKNPPTIIRADDVGETVDFVRLMESAGFEMPPGGVLVISSKTNPGPVAS